MKAYYYIGSKTKEKSMSIILIILITSCVSYTLTSCVSCLPKAWWVASEIEYMSMTVLVGQKWLQNRLMNIYSVFLANLLFFSPPNICISEIQIECFLLHALLCTSNEVEKCTLMTESYLVLNRVNCF